MLLALGVFLSACVTGPPAPTAFPVGHLFFTLNDAERTEPSTQEEDQSWIGVHAWYPAVVEEPAKFERPLYIDGPLAEQLEKVQGIPSWIPVGADAFAYEDAPQRPGRYPVLIFNHGFTSFATQSSVLAEHLASHGYVVLSIEHPFESLYAHDDKGGGVPIRLTTEVEKARTAVAKDLEKYVAAAQLRADALRKSAADPTSHSAALHQFAAADPLLKHLGPNVERWVANTKRLVLALQDLDDGAVPQARRLKGILAPKRVGVFGHSFGGVVATEINVNHADLPLERFATVNFDAAGMYWGAVQPDRSLQAPALFLMAPHSAVAKDATLDLSGANAGTVRASAFDAWEASIAGAGHQNFSDLTWVPGAAWMGLAGPGPGPAIGSVVTNQTRRFFDATLKDGPRFALDGTFVSVSRSHPAKEAAQSCAHESGRADTSACDRLHESIPSQR